MDTRRDGEPATRRKTFWNVLTEKKHWSVSNRASCAQKLEVARGGQAETGYQPSSKAEERHAARV